MIQSQSITTPGQFRTRSIIIDKAICKYVVCLVNTKIRYSYFHLKTCGVFLLKNNNLKIQRIIENNCIYIVYEEVMLLLWIK